MKFSYEVKFLKNAKRFTLRVLQNQTVRVTVRKGTSESEIQKFILKYADWIQKKITAIQSLPPKKLVKFSDGEFVPFLGEELCLKITEGHKDTFTFQNYLYVSLSSKKINLEPEQKEQYIKKALIKWYQQQALQRITEKAQLYCAQLGILPKTISLKNYKSRWGACSSKGDLIFNWQIIIKSEQFFNYVVAHEVCHLKQMNHSPKFYAQLEQLGFYKSEIKNEIKKERLNAVQIFN